MQNQILHRNKILTNIISTYRAIFAEKHYIHVKGGIDIYMAVWRACLSYAGDAR